MLWLIQITKPSPHKVSVPVPKFKAVLSVYLFVNPCMLLTLLFIHCRTRNIKIQNINERHFPFRKEEKHPFFQPVSVWLDFQSIYRFSYPPLKTQYFRLALYKSFLNKMKVASPLFQYLEKKKIFLLVIVFIYIHLSIHFISEI